MTGLAPDCEVHRLGDVLLQSGQTLRDARLAYKAYGRLNTARDNVVVYPTHFTGRHRNNEFFIGPGRPLDTDRYFVIVPNLFGNGLSSSPSNTPPPQDRARFPRITIHDNVVCQHRLLEERFGIARIALVCGWSMGGIQAYQWGALYPEAVQAILPWCASARCSRHNFVFLDGCRAALMADCTFEGGLYTEPPERGLRAFARVYAGWAYSQTWYREERYRDLGFPSVEHLLTWWEEDHLGWDANDLLAKLWTWQHADIAANEQYRGDLAAALGAIRARAIVMPSVDDLYFPPEDNVIEVALMPNAELRPIHSHWGHCAGGPGRVAAAGDALARAMRELLAPVRASPCA